MSRKDEPSLSHIDSEPSGGRLPASPQIARPMSDFADEPEEPPGVGSTGPKAGLPGWVPYAVLGSLLLVSLISVLLSAR